MSSDRDAGALTSAQSAPGNSQRARKRPATSTSWKAGQSGNPGGRRPDSQSWAAIWRELSNKTPAELLAEIGGPTTELGRALAKLPPNVAMKHLIAMRVLAAIMAEPTAGLVNAVMNTEITAEFEERLSALERSVQEDQAQETTRNP